MDILIIFVTVAAISLSPFWYFHRKSLEDKQTFTIEDNRPLLRRLASSLFEINDSQYRRLVRSAQRIVVNLKRAVSGRPSLRKTTST